MKHMIKPTPIKTVDGFRTTLNYNHQQFVMDSTWLIDEYNNILLFNHKEPKINCFEVQRGG